MPKGHPVASRPAKLIRHDLVARLDEGARYPVTVIMAPAGSGKSTLLEQWSQAHRDECVILCRIHEHDDDPLRFFRRLIHAIRKQVSDFDTSWFNPLLEPIDFFPDIIAEQLGEAMSRIEGDVYLLLDDFQHFTSTQILAVFSHLCENLPPGVHLIFASRGMPALPLSKIRLEDRLLIIDKDDLRWNEAQILHLNSQTGGKELSPECSANLLKVTEGWVAGVRLALMAHARSGAVTIENFTGSQPEIVEYFAQVVFKGLSEAVRDFFLCSSIFDKFNAGLCDHVMERQDSALLMEKISARDLFLITMENEPGWYRYHPLLRNYIHSRLQVERQQSIAGLHSRATSYFLEKGRFEAALQHARLSGDNTRFIQVLEASCRAWLNSGHFAEILRWVSPLAESLILERKRLIIPLISALTLSRRFNQAWYYLDALLAASPALPARSQCDDTELRYLDVSLNSFQKHLAFSLGEHWDLLLRPETRWELRAPALTLVAYHHLMEARLDLAIRHATQSKALLAQLGHVFLESFTDLIIALCYRNAGQAHMASRNVILQYENTDKSAPAWANRATAMVVVLYEQNQLDGARQLCEELITVINTSSATEAIATVYITLSRIFFQQKMPQRAHRALEQLCSILHLGNYERFLSQAAQESIRQLYLSGRSDTLDTLANRFSLDRMLAEGMWESVRVYDESWERYGLATAYWLLAKGSRHQAKRLLKVISATARLSEMRARALVVDALLLVISATEQERDEQALALALLFERYGLENISRYVFDEAPGFGELLNAAHASGCLELPGSYLDTFAEFFPQDTPRPLTTHHATSRARELIYQQLTGREQEIFDCLVKGLSNADISEKTGIALSTIKWHLKNIYGKLGITSRTEAILLVAPTDPLATN